MPPRKEKSSVIALKGYRFAAKPEQKPLIDDVIRLYRDQKMIYSVAERTAQRLVGTKPQIEKAKKDIIKYTHQTSQKERIAKDKELRDKPIRNWYVKGTVKVKTRYKNKHSDKVYEDELPEALTIRARSAEEAVYIFKDLNAKELGTDNYDKEHQVENITVESVKNDDNFIADSNRKQMNRTQVLKAKSVHHTLMREARYPKYDYIPHSEKLLKNEGFCVDDQFLGVYGCEAPGGIKKLTKDYFNQLCYESLLNYDDLKEVKWEPEDGKTPAMLQYVCEKLGISHYAFDITCKCVLKHVAPNRNYPALVYYCVNNHMYHISNKQAALEHTRKARDIETKITSQTLNLDEERDDKTNRFEGKAILENIPIPELINHDKCIIIYHNRGRQTNKNDLNQELDQIIEHYNYIPTIKNNKFQVIRINFKLEGKDITLEIDPNDTRNITYKDISKLCSKHGIEFQNQPFGTFIQQLKDKVLNAKSKRHAFSKEERVQFHKDCFEKCNMCEKTITRKEMHIDHIIPLARGGLATDKSNLQCLCKKCHFEKTKNEQENGYVKVSETHSSFNQATYDIINSGLCNAYAFVETVGKIPKGWENYQVYKMDINKCRKNCLYYSKYKLPLFTVMDEPIKYHTGMKKQAGLYYVETKCSCPMRGNGWYSQPLVEYCITEQLIEEKDIKYVVIASIQVAENYFNEFIDFCYKNLGDFAKLAINSMIGCFKPKVREHWKSLAITTDFNQAYNLLIDRKGCFIDCRTIGDKDYYQAYEAFNTKREETEAPIYNMILDMEAIELHKLMKVVWSKGGRVLDLSTDCVSCVFENNKFPFKVEKGSCNIKGYYYAEDKQNHRYKLEMTGLEADWSSDGMPKPKLIVERLKIERMPNFTRTNEFSRQEKDWNITPDREDDNFEPLIKDILDNNLSTNIRGCAGSGKSTFVNQLQQAMDERGIKYIALAPTNKAARIIKGQTIHRFIARASNKLLKEMDAKYFFIDEVSMMHEIFYKFFCTLKRLRPELKFIIAGDFRQFLPVADRVEGCNYENSSALKELCDDNMIQLTKCRRSDDRLFTKCLPENIGKVQASEFGNKITKRHICFTNKVRKELNEQMMQLEAKSKASRNKTNIVELEALDYDDNSQNVKVFAGLPVIARVNSKDFDLCNNDTMTVSKVRLKTKEFEVVREDGSKLDVKFDLFQKLFYPAYAITSHKAQGSTYDHPYTIWEWTHPRFDERAKYVVLSRSKKYEHINIR